MACWRKLALMRWKRRSAHAALSKVAVMVRATMRALMHARERRAKASLAVKDKARAHRVLMVSLGLKASRAVKAARKAAHPVVLEAAGPWR